MSVLFVGPITNGPGHSDYKYQNQNSFIPFVIENFFQNISLEERLLKSHHLKASYSVEDSSSRKIKLTDSPELNLAHHTSCCSVTSEKHGIIVTGIFWILEFSTFLLYLTTWVYKFLFSTLLSAETS